MVDGFEDVVWLFINQIRVKSKWVAGMYMLYSRILVFVGFLTKYKCSITLRPDIAHFKHQALL